MYSSIGYIFTPYTSTSYTIIPYTLNLCDYTFCLNTCEIGSDREKTMKLVKTYRTLFSDIPMGKVLVIGGIGKK